MMVLVQFPHVAIPDTNFHASLQVATRKRTDKLTYLSIQIQVQVGTANCHFLHTWWYWSYILLYIHTSLVLRSDCLFLHI